MKKSSKIILGIVIILVIALIGGAVWAVVDRSNKLKNEIDDLKNNINQNSVNESNTIANTNDNNETSNSKSYETITAKYNNTDDDWIYNGKNTKVAFDTKENEGLSITDIQKNSDGTYTIKGVVYSNYILTDDEFENLENGGYIYINGVQYKEDNSTTSKNENINLVKVNNSSSDSLQYFVNKNSKVVLSNAQFQNCYRITDKHMQITVDKDVLVLNSNESAMENGEGETVEELYESKNGSIGYDDESGNKNNINIKLYNFVFKNDKCFEMYAFPYES